MSKKVTFLLSVVVLVSIVAGVFGQQFNITAFKSVDSSPSNVTIADANATLTVDEDIFELIIANVSLPHLYTNHVIINQELSILQIVNCSLTEMHEGSLKIDSTLALIRISHNLLTQLKRGIFNEIKVKEIDLSNNLISTIDSSTFDNMTHLEIVILNYNLIKEINPDWFINSPNVYKLSLIYNEILEVPEKAFRNMNHQRPLKLRLSANGITRVHPHALSDHKAVEILRLNGNKLTELPKELFQTNIRVLQINTNDLKCFPDDIFNNTVQILEFMENTHFHCDCLYKVRTLVETKKVSVLYPSIICEDKQKQVNVVFNYNKTYEIPLEASSV